MDGQEQVAEIRMVLGRTLIWYNKLLADLHFWVTVYRSVLLSNRLSPFPFSPSSLVFLPSPLAHSRLSVVLLFVCFVLISGFFC